jgi:hypothetical protein
VIKVTSNASFDRAHSAPGACRNHVLVFTQEWECAMEAYAASCGNGHLFGLHFSLFLLFAGDSRTDGPSSQHITCRTAAVVYAVQQGHV